MNPKESLHKEACLDEASEHKSPWQQRQPCKRTILSPRVLKASALYYKSKKITTYTATRVIRGKDITSVVTLGATNRPILQKFN